MMVSVIAAAKRKRRKMGICGQALGDDPGCSKFLGEHDIGRSISLNPDVVLKTTVAVQDVETLSQR